MILEQSWLLLDNPRPRPPKEDNIVSGIHQHNSISNRDQLCQDSGVGTAPFPPGNPMHRPYFWHRLEDMESAERESRCAILVYGGYLFEYYQLQETVARHADRLKNWSSESCRMHKWLGRLSLQQEADLAYPTSSRRCCSRCIFGDFPSLRGAPVRYPGAPEMGDVPNGTAYIWNYPCSIMFRR